MSGGSRNIIPSREIRGGACSCSRKSTVPAPAGTRDGDEMRLDLLALISTSMFAAAPQKRPLPPPTLWNGITEGMAVTAILAKNPGAVEKDGELVLPPITVDGLTYFPKVRLSDRRASIVTLGTSRGSTSEFLAALSAKYGRPIQPWECIDQNGAETCQAYWRGARGLRVKLTYLGVLGAGEMKISYQIANGQGL